MEKRILVLLAALAVVLAPLAVVSPASARACADPVYTTTDPDGMWFHGRYVVHNNMWNASGYDVSQRLSACSPGNWRVRARADNSSGDGAVKTYPNVHVDYHNWSTGHEPKVRAFKTIRSRFASRTPGRGIYNAAYDIWLNGVPGNREVMIWTDNHKQVPSGSRVARGLRFSGRSWRVYATEDKHYIAFVPRRRLTSGTINIKARLRWLMERGLVPRRSTLGQIGFGIEIVSTGGRARTFKVDRFAVRSARR
jgi:hypothetical protein